MEDQVKRTHRELSRDEKVAVIQHLHPFLVKGKLQRGAYKQVAEKLSLSPRTWQDSIVAIRATCPGSSQLAQSPVWDYGHQVGQLLVNVDAAVYRDFVINKVIPVIKVSFPSASKHVLLQHDNALPYGSITDAVLEGVSTDGWSFKIRKQPPNSPDLNVLDLGFFASIQSLQYKKMSRTVDDVVRNTMEAYGELKYDKLEAVFLTFQAVMRMVLEHGGDNHFALPHLKKAALKRAGLLMSNVSCPVSQLL
ncbi:hypothetical protein H310_10130 [Aphanomyces invadans]|uniref:Uncharacterized protein n=1 Tax=Aphanomyces invadans TaxID=157072 RepID=A0A024TS47_9STRA|nr:hypothetical protein H310_10130 [Aphanomyces invadans]ETV96843.1 hypothetical protein H310_10130 [Aphanomyces invadans]|eukprot:XP_008874620.1 hypothetical protein H310_10130 [Aphanomyces invadans]